MVNQRVDESLVKLVKSMEGDRELLQTIQILTSMCSMAQLKREMVPSAKLSDEDQKRVTCIMVNLQTYLVGKIFERMQAGEKSILSATLSVFTEVFKFPSILEFEKLFLKDLKSRRCR